MDWEACLKEGVAKVATIDCIKLVFANLVRSLFLFVGLTAGLLIIFSGYKYMNSGGDPKKLETARNTLIYTVVGVLVVVSAYFILNLISYVTGVECIRTFGFDCK